MVRMTQATRCGRLSAINFSQQRPIGVFKNAQRQYFVTTCSQCSLRSLANAYHSMPNLPATYPKTKPEIVAMRVHQNRSMSIEPRLISAVNCKQRRMDEQQVSNVCLYTVNDNWLCRKRSNHESRTLEYSRQCHTVSTRTIASRFESPTLQEVGKQKQECVSAGAVHVHHLGYLHVRLKQPRVLPHKPRRLMHHATLPLGIAEQAFANFGTSSLVQYEHSSTL